MTADEVFHLSHSRLVLHVNGFSLVALLDEKKILAFRGYVEVLSQNRLLTAKAMLYRQYIYSPYIQHFVSHVSSHLIIDVMTCCRVKAGSLHLARPFSLHLAFADMLHHRLE